MVDASTVIGYVANGVVFGSILALAAVGLSLVYGILKLSNFAHGDFLTFGAFAAFVFVRDRGTWMGPGALFLGIVLVAFVLVDWRWKRWILPPERATLLVVAGLLLAPALFVLAVGAAPSGEADLTLVFATLLAIVASVALMFVLEAVVWRPLRRRGGTILTLIIVSIGVSLVVRNLLLLEFGGGIHAFPRPTPVSSFFLGAPVSNAQRLAVVLAAFLIGGLHVFLRYTRTGKAMRAVSDNIDLARVTGIHVERIVVYVWAISGALVAVAGVLLALVNNNTLTANMGFGLILPLFAAVILGGIGSPYGAILGGLAVGLGMKLSVLWLGTQYEVATAFIILIVVLAIRPTGILGARP